MSRHKLFRSLLSLIVFGNTILMSTAGILFPQDSESRELKSLDGIWNFRIAPRNSPNLGFEEEWFNTPLEETGEVELMPVPSSYNDLTQNVLIRDHVGWAWYDRTFWLHSNWVQNRRLFLRFGSINYHAIVWINGIQVTEHSGGHLPFETELTASSFLKLHLNGQNRITVAVNNTLSSDTVPQGELFRPTDERYPEGYFTLNYNFDFFNYAGIHRPVYLYTTPQSYIDDISVFPTVTGTTGIINYHITYISSQKSSSPKENHKASRVTVALLDKGEAIVTTGEGETGILEIPEAKLWWPFTMVQNDSDAGYLYTFVVTLSDDTIGLEDAYRLNVGIRSVKWTNTTFLINDKPFYFRGFGRHEDFYIHGRGIDNVMLVKDHNLVKWTGANSYRTSHYPYAEEIMDLTDRLGIVIIDECPAVSLSGFGSKLLANHKQSIRELIQRDKNRASVVMWSVGNEPQSQLPAAEEYFREVIDLTRTLDSQRPLTLVTNQGWSNDKTVSKIFASLPFDYYRDVVNLTRFLDNSRPITLVVAQEFNKDVTAQFVDIISINRYFSWYSDAGHTEVIRKSMILDVQNWIKKFEKPLIVAEYGADTVAGIHNSPDFVFSEEYQVTMMREHFKAFDFLRTNTTLIGEHIWNFADFMTAQGITRISGNRKGIFTRDRQPKASAHYLRTRYHLLAQEADDYPLPPDLNHEFPIYNE